MSEKLERVSKLLKSQESRTAFIKAKLSVLVPAQIRALRLKSVNPPMPYQRDLAQESNLHQSRISMFETPGEANMTIETLAKIAAGLRVGVLIQFVPMSKMIEWKDNFSIDKFDVKRLDEDQALLEESSADRIGEFTRLADLVEIPRNGIAWKRAADNECNSMKESGKPGQGAFERAAAGWR